ncbi:MAG: tRNA preQ1(34) S-adenosylmethionine ribosyltransferase-isomerase QueA [Clostridiales bacterium]|nr:tRNA preQ1(34) S-adenosylmethionine ribosyltransferase-isomerase QueA [Clostridiales bacterium]
MKTSDFFYELPDELIAQTPVEPRNMSRLMLLDKKSGKTEHKIFKDFSLLLHENDCLILNDTRVIPARIFGTKDSGASVEFLLLKQCENDVWQCLVKPGKRAKTGAVFTFGGGLMAGEIISVNSEDGSRLVKFSAKRNIYTVLDEIGGMPLPPYIKEKLEDKERYQTVYSRPVGSAAAPTAGLHFTKEMLLDIKNRAKIGYVTLHVGLGTFRPVKEEKVENHLMHSEHYILPAETADLINETKKSGGRVIAVGTTTCRTLESVASKFNEIRPDEGDTSIFIYPGYKFKCIDALLTNFHLPESTLIMLVSAFAGYENTMRAYKTAVNEKYRFFSFGDAMFIS